METGQKSIIVLGNNYDGCLLTGDTNDVIDFRKINLSQFINMKNYKISTGMKSVAIYDDKQVHIFGRFADKEVTHLPKSFNFENKIVKISSGDYHILILTDDGCVYSLGKGLHGELGLGEDLIEVHSPTKLNVSNIKNVYAGVRTSFLIYCI
jgi:alpha-tubulin suppressor-like RCC1 family protein